MVHLQHKIDLTPLNTLHLKSTAQHYIALEHMEQLNQLPDLIASTTRFFVLGGGSNLIVPSTYDGLVIHNRLLGIEYTVVGNEYLVTAMAGEHWDNFVASCIEHGAFGLENLSLIPGTVGASPIQNIGAYGVEVKEFIDEVLVYDLENKKLVSLSNEQCAFSYRTSLLKNNSRYIVVSVRFRLAKKPSLNLSYGDVAQQLAAISSPTPMDLRNVIIAIRQSKLPDPQELGNVGSFFHNPILPQAQVQALRDKHPKLPLFATASPDCIKISAGWLIDNLGLKGWRDGNVGVYPKQALVLVNYGGACQRELLAFAEQIQEQVERHYAVSLQIEPIILS